MKKQIIGCLLVIIIGLSIGLMVMYRHEISKLGEPKKSIKKEQATECVAIESFDLYSAMGLESMTLLINGEELYDYEIELIALVTIAEAEGEPELGKRLVIDTILNRVESPHFPNTIEDVIYQPSQFSSVWNGRMDKCSIDIDILRLVKEEVTNRTNNEVVFFRTEKYSSYGEPLFVVGNHYFSSLF